MRNGEWVELEIETGANYNETPDQEITPPLRSLLSIY
jgi:hypothetical protein